MEAIGKQVKLPISTAVQIALQGIKIRLGRAVVTITGVVLGIAFLMNVLAGSLISQTVKDEQDLRMKVDMMIASVKIKVGEPKNKQIAVVGIGELADYELETLKSLKKMGASVRGYGFNMTGVSATSNLSEVSRGADVVLLMGPDTDCPATAAQLTEGLKYPVILDTLAGRTYAGAAFTAVGSIERELFFGTRMQEEQQEKMKKVQQAQFRTIWIVSISLLVTIIGIANALLMSVTERFKEIGTMKCLGALSSFIRQLFLIESAVVGAAGSFLGIVIGILFPMLAYSFAYGWNTVWGSLDYSLLGIISLCCLLAGTALSIVAAIYPATMAARMIPAMALRSNV